MQGAGEGRRLEDRYAVLGRHGAGASTAPDRMLAAFCLVVTSVITGALGALIYLQCKVTLRVSE